MAENNSSAPLKTAQGEDERALFEAVASDHGLWPKAIERDAKGNYLLLTTANGWMWWQHARSMPTAAHQAAVRAEPVTPYAWHYWNAGGASVYHRGESKKLEADMSAAAAYPRVHHCIPLYTAPQAQPADALDAERWRMLPAFYEEYQINGLKLMRDIDAAMAAAQEGGEA